MSRPESAAGDLSAADTMALTSLAERSTVRTRRVLATYFLGRNLWTMGKQAYNRARTQMSYTVAVAGGDEIYPELHRWLLERIPSTKRRSLAVRTEKAEHRSNAEVVPGGFSEEGRSLVSLYDGSREQTVMLGGQRIRVHIERPERARALDLNDDATPRWAKDMERIVFTANNEMGREAVLRLLTEVAQSHAQREPKLYIAEKWGGWQRRQEYQARDLSTVVLREGQAEGLVEDLRRFLVEEEVYGRFGIPWHRGYLFHGPPGTGKTSLAKALAGHYGLDIHYMPLPVIADDSRLMQALAAVDARSMLVIEDIDIVHGARERTDTEPGVTLSGLLNCLDGMVTPHGLISVLTTNDLTVIDPALTRPGRVDRIEEVGYLDREQYERLVAMMTEGQVVAPAGMRDKLTPAEVVEVVKSTFGDVEATVTALKELGE